MILWWCMVFIGIHQPNLRINSRRAAAAAASIQRDQGRGRRKSEHSNEISIQALHFTRKTPSDLSRLFSSLSSCGNLPRFVHSFRAATCSAQQQRTTIEGGGLLLRNDHSRFAFSEGGLSSEGGGCWNISPHFLLPGGRSFPSPPNWAKDPSPPSPLWLATAAKESLSPSIQSVSFRAEAAF